MKKRGARFYPLFHAAMRLDYSGWRSNLGVLVHVHYYKRNTATLTSFDMPKLGDNHEKR